MAGRRVHPADPDHHRPGDLRHRRDRHRVDRQPRAGRRARAARARLLLRDDGDRARARADRRQPRSRPARGFDAARDASARAEAQGGDRRGRRRLRASSRSSPTTCCPTSFVAAVRRQRDPAACSCSAILIAAAISFLRRRRAQARRRRASRSPSRIIFGDHPDHHVGGAAGRVRRHGLHGRAVRLGVARQPRAADGHLLGHVRDLRVRRARPGRAAARLQHRALRPA